MRKLIGLLTLLSLLAGGMSSLSVVSAPAHAQKTGGGGGGGGGTQTATFAGNWIGTITTPPGTITTRCE